MAFGSLSALVNGAPVSLLSGSDNNGNKFIAHVNVDGNGVEKGTSTNPNYVTDIAAITALQAVQSSTAASATAAGQAAALASTSAVATAMGSPADTPWLGSGSASVVALIKNACAKLAGTLTVAVNGPLSVTGMFWQTIQPVSATVLPLPTGASTDATLAALSSKIDLLNTKIDLLNSYERPPYDAAPMAVGTSQAKGRAVFVDCTTAGRVSLKLQSGVDIAWAVNVGPSFISGEYTTVNSAGTTATATYTIIK